jgi:putative transposase
MHVGRSKGFLVDRVNGYVDHVHLLFALRSTQRIADILHHIKGESSRYINKNQLMEEPFEWQTDYYACSVSDYGLPAIRKYIDNQENHHQTITYKRELQEMSLGAE